MSEIYINPQITKTSNLSEFSFSDICRYATSSEEARDQVSKFDLRPLSLKKPYELYPHQEQAIHFMKKMENETTQLRGGIVSLKMGLGKTLSALSHILTAPKGEWPTLIVVSKTIIDVWIEDGINKFFADSHKPKVCVFTKKTYKNYASVVPEDFKEYDIVITTYTTLSSVYKKIEDKIKQDIQVMGDIHSLMNGRVAYLRVRTSRDINLSSNEPIGLEALYYINWERIVCDEAHVFTNSTTLTFSAVMAVVSKNRWCLTGTPFRNDYEDIYSLLRFSGWDDGVSKSFNDFKRKRDCGIREICNKYILSMGYKEVDIKLPQSHEIIHKINFLDKQEKQYYRWMFSFILETIEDYEGAETITERRQQWGFILALFTHLRQASITAYLTRTSQKIREKCINNKVLLNWLDDKNGTAGKKSTKIAKVFEIAKSIPLSDKFIIFSTFSSALEILFEFFEENAPEMGCIIVDGENSNQRDFLIESFKNNKDIRCLFTTYKIGSEGLNLTEANHCIFVDPWWSDTVHQQARARILRTGQQKETYIYHVEIENTIEKRILEKCKEKQQKEHSMLNETFQKVESGISLKLMKELMRS